MTKMKFKIFKHDSHVWGQRCLDGTTVTFNDQRSQELYRSSRPPAGLKPEINFVKDQNNQSCLISFTTCCCYFHQDWHQDEVEVWLSDDLVGGSGVGILGVTVRGIGTRGGNTWGRGKGSTHCDKMPRKGSGDFFYLLLALVTQFSPKLPLLSKVLTCCVGTGSSIGSSPRSCERVWAARADCAGLGGMQVSSNYLMTMLLLLKELFM